MSKLLVTLFQSISPGAVDTEIFDEEFRKSDVFKNTVASSVLKPDDIADAAIYVLSTPPHVQVNIYSVSNCCLQFLTSGDCEISI